MTNKVCGKTSPIFEKLGNTLVTSAEKLEGIRLTDAELKLIQSTDWRQYKLTDIQLRVVQRAKQYCTVAISIRDQKNREQSGRRDHTLYPETTEPTKVDEEKTEEYVMGQIFKQQWQESFAT